VDGWPNAINFNCQALVNNAVSFICLW